MFKAVFKNHYGKTVYELSKLFDSIEEADEAIDDEMLNWSGDKQEALTPSIEEA